MSPECRLHTSVQAWTQRLAISGPPLNVSCVPRMPSFLTICLTTSMGPANVLDLSWSLQRHKVDYGVFESEGKNVTYLILTSSNGTTTKLSVAPALEPVRMAISWFIFVCPESPKKVFPQKSFAALYAVSAPIVTNRHIRLTILWRALEPRVTEGVQVLFRRISVT